MLNNELQSEEMQDPQFARRVTPDEFSAAVVAIQKRKAEKERLLNETVAVDEVVQDLNIDATPEEILAEVEKLRKAKLQPEVAPQPIPVQNRPVGFARIVPSTRSPRSRGTRIITSVIVWSVVISALTGLFSSGLGQSFSRIFGANANEQLSAVPMGHHVTISNSELDRLLKGASPSSITVTDNVDLFSAPWTLVQENGQYYIWAYAEKPLPTNLSKTTLILYNDMGDVPTDEASELTVPVSSLKGDSVGGEGENGTIDVNGLVLDNHKDDDWASN